MPRCSGFKTNGAPCERIVRASQEYCYSHDPAHAERRHRAAAKAAKSKPHNAKGELADVKAKLWELVNGVLEKDLDRADAVAAGQLLNTVLRAIEQQRRARETDELEARLAELEQLLEARTGYGPSVPTRWPSTTG